MLARGVPFLMCLSLASDLQLNGDYRKNFRGFDLDLLILLGKGQLGNLRLVK